MGTKKSGTLVDIVVETRTESMNIIANDASVDFPSRLSTDWLLIFFPIILTDAGVGELGLCFFSGGLFWKVVKGLLPPDADLPSRLLSSIQRCITLQASYIERLWLLEASTSIKHILRMNEFSFCTCACIM